MRGLTVAVLGLLLAAGCSGPEVTDDAVGDEGGTPAPTPPAPTGSSYTFITVSGTIVESGPDYSAYRFCGESVSSVDWDVRSREMWVSAQAVGPKFATSPLLVVSAVDLHAMHPEDCGMGRQPVAAYNHSFALPFWWTQPQLRMEFDGETWSVGGTPIPPDQEATFAVSSSYPRPDRFEGAVYEYRGNVTFRNEGPWPHSKARVLAEGWTSCCPPPEPEPTMSPGPVPLLYHVLQARATVMRDPPAPSPTGPQPVAGACVASHNDLGIDEANGTLYVRRGQHPIDPWETHLLVHEPRGGRWGCSPDQAWVVASAETWRVAVGGGDFTFPISDAWWANGTYVSGRLLSSDPGKDRTLTLQRSLESDGVRWTVVAEFTLLGPWSMRDLHGLDANATMPQTSLWAAWRT